MPSSELRGGLPGPTPVSAQERLGPEGRRAEVPGSWPHTSEDLGYLPFPAPSFPDAPASS